MYAFPKGKAQLWFQRNYNIELNKTEWVYGSNLRGSKKIWEQSTRDDSLFLFMAIQLNSEILKPISHWFRNKLKVRTSNNRGFFHEKKYCESADGKLNILNFLKAADLGIEDLSLKQENLKLDLPDELPLKLKEIISWDASNKVATLHRTDSGNDVILDLEENESEGTKRLFSMSSLFLDAYENGDTIFIDELDCSLHPHIVSFIIKQFCNPKINKSNAQLIFTTHDVSLLSQKQILRSDQVWFIDKNYKHESKLYSLIDFSTKKDIDFEKAYLLGRFGVVPNISFENLKDIGD